VSPFTDALLERAIRGDEDALAELLAQNAAIVRRGLDGKIPRRWQSVLSVEDVMQETYIEAFLDVAHFEPREEGSFTAWLSTLAKRNLVDALRMLEAEKRGKHRRAVQARPGDDSMGALYTELVCSNSTPSRQAARNEAGNSLLRAITQLPAIYRTVVEMYDLEQRSVDDVARAVGRSPGAVFMLRSRAHRQLGMLMGAASQFLSGAR
jgi:RNA polymerase sigma-70 factor, ECF subfamily